MQQATYFDEREEWYDDERMNNLLERIDFGPGLVILKALPLDEPGGDALDLLQRALTAEFSEQEDRESEGARQQYFIPLRIHHNHWIGLYVDPMPGNPLIYWIDPMGGILSPEEKNLLLKCLNTSSIFDNVLVNAHMHSQDVILQKDGINCGPWIVEILRFIREEGRFPLETEIDIERARKEHAEFLSKPESVRVSGKKTNFRPSNRPIEGPQKSIKPRLSETPSGSTQTKAYRSDSDSFEPESLLQFLGEKQIFTREGVALVRSFLGGFSIPLTNFSTYYYAREQYLAIKRLLDDAIAAANQDESDGGAKEKLQFLNTSIEMKVWQQKEAFIDYLLFRKASVQELLYPGVGLIEEEINCQFRKLMIHFHPDKNPEQPRLEPKLREIAQLIERTRNQLLEKLQSKIRDIGEVEVYKQAADEHMEYAQQYKAVLKQKKAEELSQADSQRIRGLTHLGGRSIITMSLDELEKGKFIHGLASLRF